MKLKPKLKMSVKKDELLDLEMKNNVFIPDFDKSTMIESNKIRIFKTNKKTNGLF